MKRPKITVTESNREFVIPTLEKLGGVNNYNHIEVAINEVWYIDLDNDIDFWSVSAFYKRIDNSGYYEVDPKDYVGVKSEVFEPNHTLVVDAESYPKTLETIIELQKAEIDQLKAENDKLRECLKFFALLNKKEPQYASIIGGIKLAKQLLNK